ncbi:MAG TPA: hypothetical protein VD866_27275, partial [Urbifossiella sp.]|nr:hypothetical protein [Urbifossiella sp.]
MPGPSKRVFISVANRQHKALRAALRKVLTRAGFDVVVQPDFPHTVVDTVRKLDDLIAPCDLVVHVVGRDPGSRAAPAAVADYFSRTARTAFLAALPDARARLGDCAALTYFQWEPWLALHHGRDVLVYGVAGHGAEDFPQRAHLDALYLARQHADTLPGGGSACGRVVADVCRHFGVVPGDRVQRIAEPRFIRHTAEFFLGRTAELKRLDRAWADGTHVLSVIAWGGVGKTALLSQWVRTRFIDTQWKGPAGGTPAAYFDWSFYDQGTPHDDDKKTVRTGSVGDFFEKALAHFGDPDVTKPGKGARLAGLVREQRTLFVLDGLEPLQQPVGSPTAGRLLDPDLYDFITALAYANPGLLVITSREVLTDLGGLGGKATRQADLDDLPRKVAVQLLRKLQIAGTDEELGDASEKFGCHALSLTLLGRFLFDAHPIMVPTAGGKEKRHGDIRRIDRVRDLKKADKWTKPKRHRTAWKVLEAYEEWLQTADGNPAVLAVLRLVGLFDRTATAGCLAALRAKPVIAGLTDAVVLLGDDEWNILLGQLDEAHLLKLRVEAEGRYGVDAHPLIREFFAQQLRTTQPDAFREAHSRLYDHLCATTEHRPDTLDGLQPLYQAVVHGCRAGRHLETLFQVYVDRILRGTGPDGFYSRKQLGAVGANLAATAAFFDEPWASVTPSVPAAEQAWLLSQAAFSLRSLGRLTEAGPPMEADLKMCVQHQEWEQA